MALTFNIGSIWFPWGYEGYSKQETFALEMRGNQILNQPNFLLS